MTCAVWVCRDLRIRDLPEVFLESARTTVMIMFIVAGAWLFAHVLTTERIPQAIAEQILALGMSPWMFLLVLLVPVTCIPAIRLALPNAMFGAQTW